VILTRFPYRCRTMLSSTVRRRIRRLRASWRRTGEIARLGVAMAILVATIALCVVDPHNFRVPALGAIVLVFSSLILGPLSMLALAVVIAVASVVVPATVQAAPHTTTSGLMLLAAVTVVGVAQTSRRYRLGLRGTSAEAVIGQVRGRLRTQGALPSLPAGWRVDVEQRAADGAAIAGDFVASRLHDVAGRAVLDLVVVDVSGKGIEAGSRALLLSGAVGGLLGAVEPADFLDQTNAYLRRQHWSHGFATCVYVRIALDTGEFEVRAAGHPAPLHRCADSGAWERTRSEGTVLGVVPDLRLVVASGVLGVGDALVLFTDGVVEDRVQDIDVGVARLADEVDALLVRAARVGAPPDYAGIAATVVETVPSRLDDDRAVVLVARLAEVSVTVEPSAELAGEPRHSDRVGS
jgi:hypothetical protein